MIKPLYLSNSRIIDLDRVSAIIDRPQFPTILIDGDWFDVEEEEMKVIRELLELPKRKVS